MHESKESSAPLPAKEIKKLPIKKIYAVEVSGACNLSKTCTWCAMYHVPRKRGFMSDDTVNRVTHWLLKLKQNKAPWNEPLFLHNFGEPLLHPNFIEIAKHFSQIMPLSMSTNATYLDEKMADRLAEVPWAWISVSPWDPKPALKAISMLQLRKIEVLVPPGITHNWAGQTKDKTSDIFNSCPFLQEGKMTVRWDGSLASCCITDKEEDVIGNISQEPEDVFMRSYSLCETCHHST